MVQQASTQSNDPSSEAHDLTNMRVMRILRMSRLLRTIRVTRLVRFCGPLRTLVLQITSTMRTVFWAMLLLLLIIYFFSLLFVMGVAEYKTTIGRDWPEGVGPDLPKFWGNLSETMYTLFK